MEPAILTLEMLRPLVLLFVLSLSVVAEDWPQWRGPARDGRSAETGLAKKWPVGGPPLLWEAEILGEGYSSFAIANGRLYTQGQKKGQQFVIALDAASGKTIWEAANGDTYADGRGGGPRGAPTLDNGRVYALGSSGNLVCLEADTGKQVWDVNILSKYGGRNIRWGLSESPLIDGEKIVVSPGGRGAGVVALNKSDGALIWKSESDEAGYSSAVLAEVGGVRMYVLLTGDAAIGLKADSGELLWRYSNVANGTANVATPIVKGNHVFVSSDYGTGGALLKLSRDGNGVRADEVYFSREMRNHYSSSVLVGDYLYGFSSRIFTAMNFMTGEVGWKDRSVGKGQVIFADGNLYLQGEDGVVGLVTPDPTRYRETSRFEIGRGNYPTWTLPVIADGRLYIRDQKLLRCYDVKE